MIFDRRPCDLGEGLLWHPLREQMFWFDILAGKMLSVEEGQPREWQFPFMVSAAGWIDRDRLLIAGESGLFIFDLATEAASDLIALDAGDPTTRSNDGRADPQGGFWISTMGKAAESGRGAIWRFFNGEIRKLYPSLTIPNAICFAPDGGAAYFTDTVTKQVQRVSLDAAGWPKGSPECFLDLEGEGSEPDGAVVDAEGLLWLAQWGAGQVCAFSPSGEKVREIAFAAPNTSCPAFGGPDLTTLFCTSALQGMDAAARAACPAAGMTFAHAGAGRGRAEPAVSCGALPLI